jgi:cleavage and polyadenylation specificity factor subunit 1
LFKSGLIQVYQCTPAKPPVDGAPIERTTSLNIQLVKVFSQTFPGASLDESVLPSALIADRRAAQRLLVPFTTTGRLDRSQVSGLFLTGDRPHWFFKVDKSDFICIPCDHSIVYAFTSCSIWEGPPAFLMNTEDVCDSSKFLLARAEQTDEC